MTRRLVAFGLALALGATGCSGTDWKVAATRGLGWTAKTEEKLGLMVLVYSGGLAGTTSEDVETQAQAQVEKLLPACSSALVMGTTASYAFHGCKAPYGVGALDGTAMVTYTVNDFTRDRFDVALTAPGLSLGGSKGDVAIAGSNLFPSSAWDMMDGAALRLADTMPPASNSEDRDALIALEGSYSGAGCGGPAMAAGSPPSIASASGLVSVDDGAAWAITLSKYTRCGTGCPAPGGVLTVELDQQVKVEFDGTATGKATNLISGETASVPLGCVP